MSGAAAKSAPVSRLPVPSEYWVSSRQIMWGPRSRQPSGVPPSNTIPVAEKVWRAVAG
jgi:hypothetical protein